MKGEITMQYLEDNEGSWEEEEWEKAPKSMELEDMEVYLKALITMHGE